MDQGFGGTLFDAPYHYHSIYDSQRWQEVYADPGFVRHVRIYAVVLSTTGGTDLEFNHCRLLSRNISVSLRSALLIRSSYRSTRPTTLWSCTNTLTSM